MKTFRTLFVATLATGFFAFAHTIPTAAQAPDSLRAAVAAEVTQVMKASGTPGVQILLLRKGDTILDRGFGVRSIADRSLVGTQTRFEIGSITKQFTAAAILQLVEQKKLALDDSLGKFVPEYPTGADITLRQLLWQVSGIPNYTAVDGFREYSTTHPGGVVGILDLIRDKPLEFKPGTKWRYSNSNYALLGRVVEVASGMPWEQYIRTHIFQPAGMTHSTFNDRESSVDDMATGYTKGKNGALVAAPDMRNWPVGAGAIVSTVDDLSKWDDAFFGGRIVSPEHVKLAITPGTLADGSHTTYGFGWIMDEYAGQPRTWHNGGTFGFMALNQIYPELDERIIVLVNSAAVNPSHVADRAFAALNPKLAAAVAAAAAKAAPGEDPAITKLAQEWWTNLLSGKFDRSRLTPTMDKQLTPAVLKQSGAQLKALGAPQSWVYKGKREANGTTLYVYRVTFEGGTALNITMALTADGKLAGYLARAG